MGVAFADVFTGVYSALAIVCGARAARAHRPRHPYRHGAARHPGRRAREPGDVLSRLRPGRRNGSATPTPTVVPYQVFPVADGHIIIACGNDGQFARLAALARRTRARAGRALQDQLRARGEPRDPDPGHDRADLEVHPRGPARETRGDRRAGRADQRSRRCVRRPAGACIAACASTGRARRRRAASFRACARPSSSMASPPPPRAPRRGSASIRRRCCARSGRGEGPDEDSL